MYHRYTSRAGGLNPQGNRLKERLRTGLILLLVAAVVLLAVFGGRAMAYRSEAHTTFVSRMQTECGNAISLTSSLSRTAGANSSATLGRIRSHIYAMDTINQINVGLDGDGYLVSNDQFTALYELLDEYVTTLTTGMATGDLQTSLTNSLNELYALVDALE